MEANKNDHSAGLEDQKDENNAGSVNRSEKSTYPGEKREERPDEIPFEHGFEVDPSEHPHETEFEQQDKGNNPANSGQGDVTAPKAHEFPSYGNAKTDFASRTQGRTTGRMVSHEPGTEGI